MDLYSLIRDRRTVRKFKPIDVSKEDLAKIVDCGRLAPCGANIQALKYKIVTDEETRKQMFPYIKYAGYIPSWNPEFNECATAFIAILNDKDIRPSENAEFDCGAAMMSMNVMAEGMGLGTCMLGAINRDEICKILKIKDNLDLKYLMAVGYPDQRNTMVVSDDTIKYYMDEDGNFVVPKKCMESILVK